MAKCLTVYHHNRLEHSQASDHNVRTQFDSVIEYLHRSVSWLRWRTICFSSYHKKEETEPTDKEWNYFIDPFFVVKSSLDFWEKLGEVLSTELLKNVSFLVGSDFLYIFNDWVGASMI